MEACLVFVFEVFPLHPQQLSLLAQEFLGFAGDAGIVSGHLGNDCRGERLGSRHSLGRLYVWFLIFLAEDTAQQAFSHH
ncbi:MAG: hypothetical protein NVSMB10_16160 [Steroidobacteraceae bacterium]